MSARSEQHCDAEKNRAAVRATKEAGGKLAAGGVAVAVCAAVPACSGGVAAAAGAGAIYSSVRSIQRGKRNIEEIDQTCRPDGGGGRAR